MGGRAGTWSVSSSKKKKGKEFFVRLCWEEVSAIFFTSLYLVKEGGLDLV